MPNNKDQKDNIPRKKSDELLKGATEENIPELLRFLYPNADELFDLDKGYEVMDKELHAIVPDRERKGGSREADLLVRVWLTDGSQQLILLNVEIEGGNDPDFPLRVLQYWYRIGDRYGLPVATIVVYTGNKGQGRPSGYSTKVLDTSIHFQYRSYHIFDHGEGELLAMDNIFALIVVACQKALLEGKAPEEELGEDRSTIARALLSHGRYDNDRIISFLVFLKNFIYIKNQKINRNFDKFIHQLTGGIIDMGIIETVKLQERREGEALGFEKGKREEAIAIAREMKKDELPISQIAKFTKLSIKEIEKL